MKITIEYRLSYYAWLAKVHHNDRAIKRLYALGQPKRMRCKRLFAYRYTEFSGCDLGVSFLVM